MSAEAKSYATNLSSIYHSNDPHIFGRDEELFQMILTLSRAAKPNILLTGAPGVGKTSLVHQLAYLIGQGLVPDTLKDYQIIEINSNGILAGPGYRGVTEDKFQNMIDGAIQKGKIILFFDEFHTVEKLGQMANGQTPGLGNTLKPYLTRDDFRVIGATTDEEFKTITDGALLRRFDKINVPEPNKEACEKIISALLKTYAGDYIEYKPKVFKHLVDAIYSLSISIDGSNPDKCKDITDVFSALCKMKGVSTPDVSFIDNFCKNYVTKSFNQEGKEKFISLT
jgi:ATP-dependent Clp protease ATP-binding subunit ClpA